MRKWSSIRKENPGEFWGIVFFTFFVLIGIGVGLYFLIKMLLNSKCGKEGEKPCPSSGCDDGLEESDGVCRNPNCGQRGQSPCAGGRCNTGLSLDSASGLCATPACGGENQTPCPGADGGNPTCIDGFEERDGVCARVCSTEGYKPCPDKDCDGDLVEGIRGVCVKTGMAVLAYGGISLAGLTLGGGATYALYKRWGGVLSSRVSPSGGTSDEGDDDEGVEARITSDASAALLKAPAGSPLEKALQSIVAMVDIIRTSPTLSNADKSAAMGDLETYLESVITNPPASVQTTADVAAISPRLAAFQTEAVSGRGTQSVVARGLARGRALELMETLRKDPNLRRIRTAPDFATWLATQGETPAVQEELTDLFKRTREITKRSLTPEEQEVRDEADGYTEDFIRGAQRLGQLVGLPKALREASDFLDPGAEARQFLLYGPPGTGKTMWIRALAAERENTVVFEFSGASLTSDYGTAEKKLESMFEAARQARLNGDRAVVFIDEADGLFAPNVPVTIRTKLQTLMSDYDDVPVVLNTNEPDKIPKAVKDRTKRVEVKKFNQNARERFLLQAFTRLRGNFDAELARKISEGDKVVKDIARDIRFNGRGGGKVMKELEKMAESMEITEEMIREKLRETVKEDQEELRRMKGRQGVREALARRLGSRR